ncbi:MULTISPECIES: PrsW family intramembrane metalloprotease [Halorussus]|uniref:PrsW family intramembrane metalloprotease n=1 Tax=Halorussus TaxID=1070314 RepID=UPI0020A2158A|nr:PrsW family intramembrane metalloprotease [Halorussus vallis]USZ74787.1 PrsW family intramembrane metalloprotease [Halorussus vallis]
MERERDPVEEGATDSADLYDIATWERRSRLDGFASRVYRGVQISARAIVIVLAVLILLAQVALTGLAVAFSRPIIGAFVLLSVVPAFALAAYIWYADVTTNEPLTLLVGTFVLGVLFAGFAAIINTLAGAVTAIPLVGMALFFYFVVAPVEETVKWLAVRLYAFRSDRFDAVIDGAVYGAMAGLGFATIENAIYITQGLSDTATVGSQAVITAGQTAAVRLLAGPGHVIYSAFAGYYLGLAKFNRENAGPIAVKGLLIAAFIHATYNTAVTYLTPALAVLEAAFDVAVAPGVAFIAFILVYDGVFGYLLYRKISKYKKAYKQVNMSESVTFEDSERFPDADDSATERVDAPHGFESAESPENARTVDDSEASDDRATESRRDRFDDWD